MILRGVASSGKTMSKEGFIFFLLRIECLFLLDCPKITSLGWFSKWIHCLQTFCIINDAWGFPSHTRLFMSSERDRRASVLSVHPYDGQGRAPIPCLGRSLVVSTKCRVGQFMEATCSPFWATNDVSQQSSQCCVDCSLLPYSDVF